MSIEADHIRTALENLSIVQDEMDSICYDSLLPHEIELADTLRQRLVRRLEKIEKAEFSKYRAAEQRNAGDGSDAQPQADTQARA